MVVGSLAEMRMSSAGSLTVTGLVTAQGASPATLTDFERHRAAGGELGVAGEP